MTDRRPDWPFREMTEQGFRSMASRGRIESVTAKWEMTGADTSREWLEARSASGETFTMPSGWGYAWQFVGYSSNPGLFQLTNLGKRMVERLNEIDKWEAANARERAEYERLKTKFGD